MKNFFIRYHLYLVGLGLTFLFFLYTFALTDNPPGFYVDESAFAYNAYSIAKTGASEFGVRWPLFFQNFEPPYHELRKPNPHLSARRVFSCVPTQYLAGPSLKRIGDIRSRIVIGLSGFQNFGQADSRNYCGLHSPGNTVVL